MLFARIYCWLIFLSFFYTVVETCLLKFPLGCYILRINFRLFRFAEIQGDIPRKWRERARLDCVQTVSDAVSSLPILPGMDSDAPFKGPHGYRTSLQRHAKYFCTFQLSIMKLLLRELGDVSYCGFPLYTCEPGRMDLY